MRSTRMRSTFPLERGTEGFLQACLAQKNDLYYTDNLMKKP
jgi:hypothetical protein